MARFIREVRLFAVAILLGWCLDLLPRHTNNFDVIIKHFGELTRALAKSEV